MKLSINQKMVVNSYKNKSLKIAVLGSSQSGKSDFLYSHTVRFDDIITEIEVLDTSNCKNAQCLYDHINWGNAFVIVYSISDPKSFIQCRHLLETISVLKGPGICPTLLLANKSDLADFARQVDIREGQQMSLQYKCHFYEVSAAESSVGVCLAFQSLIREVLTEHVSNLPTVRRKTNSVITVSKMIEMVFGKNTKNDRKGKKKSLSI